MSDKVKHRKYGFKGRIWRHAGLASWYFVSLPKNLSMAIRRDHGISEEGWGRLRATALIGTSKWQTAIWFDTKVGAYLLPIKASVRKNAQISSGSMVSVTLYLKEESLKLFGR